MLDEDPVVLRLLAESGDNGDSNGGCDYVLIELSRSGIALILERTRRFLEFEASFADLGDGPTRLVFYGVAQFLGDSECGETPPADGPQDMYEWLEALADAETGQPMLEATKEGDWGVLPLDAQVPEFLQRRTETDVLHIHKDGDLEWLAHPRNLGTVIDSPLFPTEALQEFLATGSTGVRCPSMRLIQRTKPELAQQMAVAGL